MTHKLLALTFVMGLLLTSVSQATLLTYDYVGPNFDSPIPLPFPYEDGDHIEGFITIDDAFLDASGSGILNANKSGGVESWLIELSFTDGVKTINDLSTLDNWSLRFKFSSLNLTEWSISLVNSTFSGILSDGIQLGNSVTILDSAAEGSGTAVIATADRDPPAWDRSIAVPEPTTLVLFTLGLAGLGWAQRRKRKVA